MGCRVCPLRLFVGVGKVVGELYFQRGQGPLVSVLLPTRGRPASLMESIDSLFSLAKLRSMEFILKIDEDDSETLKAYESLKQILPCKAIVSGRGRGYLDMHEWVNQMARLATGDWMLLWNDDARMATHDWDLLLFAGSINEKATWHGVSDICMFIASTIGRPSANEFCFVRRKVIEVIGHWSMNPHNDTWIFAVMAFLSSVFAVPIEVKHLSNEINDEVRKSVLACYDQTGRAFNSLEQVKLRMEDVTRLVEYLRRNGARLS